MIRVGPHGIRLALAGNCGGSAVGKKLLGFAAMAVVLLSCGTGCRLWCDGYCDRRDRDCDNRSSRRDGCNDPCRTQAPPSYNDCR